MQCLPWELSDAFSSDLDTLGEPGGRPQAAGSARGTPAAAPLNAPRCALPHCRGPARATAGLGGHSMTCVHSLTCHGLGSAARQWAVVAGRQADQGT